MENQIDSIHQKALIRYLMYVEKTNNLVLDDRNNYESQWTNRLVLVDISCRTSVWNT